MPTLQFKGKNTIWNHHLSIPYHTLDEVKNLNYKPEDGEGNLIIEGDNLIALKALMPMYRGKIKRICIDPPYNTGTENNKKGWVYNDNVNSPLIKEWIGKYVSEDDLTKHDKWLCMMTPRLKLLFDLLDEDGIIFICIDHHELSNLISLMNEIFLEENALAILTWRGMHTVRNSSKDFNKNSEYIIVYCKSKTNLIKAGAFDTYLRYPMDKTEKYPLNDNDGKGFYKLDPLHARNYYTPYKFKFTNGIVWEAPEGSYPRYAEETLEEMEINKEIEFDGNVPRAKRYLERVKEGVPPDTLLPSELVGFNKDGTKELSELFDKKVFDQPKPVKLIKHLLRFQRKIDTTNYIVLDSFAGSGTSGQSVLELNQDGKKRKENRKFILIQMKENSLEDPNVNICKDITRERVKRAIEKYKYKSGFKYLKVGIPIDAETMLSGKLPEFNELAKFVYYLCTGQNLNEESKIKEQKYYVGQFGSLVIYLIYKKDFETLKNLALTLDLAEKFKLQNPKKRIIVYAPACFLDEEYLTENQISYVGIPYNLFEKR